MIASTVPPLFDEDLATTDGVYQNMQTFWRSQNVLDYETDLAIEQIVDQALMEEARRPIRAEPTRLRAGDRSTDAD